ncbi:MAG TPA: hypothetical protein VMU11_04050 [Verrucomicrobiae bacterium]|nr:hypothetical protein [Verrucomicrobiae bacterium]
MMERPMSKQDAYVEKLGRKMERQDILDRMRDRSLEIARAIERNYEQYDQANPEERIAMTAELFRLEGQLSQLRAIYEKKIKSKREDKAGKPVVLNDAEERLLEEETPILLTRGKRPLRDTAETGIEMELEDQDLKGAEVIGDTPASDVEMELEDRDLAEDESHWTRAESEIGTVPGEGSGVRRRELPVKQRLQTPQGEQVVFDLDALSRADAEESRQMKELPLSREARLKELDVLRDQVLDTIDKAILMGEDKPAKKDALEPIVRKLSGRLGQINKEMQRLKNEDGLEPPRLERAA